MESAIKPATTYEEQLEKLKSRGLLIGDENLCLDLLSTVNYYRFSAYLLPFRKSDHGYFEGITFEQVYQVYEFDRKMRVLLGGIIEEIELNLRTKLTYYHVHKYGPIGYLNPANYDKRHNHEEFQKQIIKMVDDHPSSPIVIHHLAYYDGIFPLWTIIDFFSTGNLSYFFSDMISSDRTEISTSFFDVPEEFLRSWLRCLTDLRNKCAHYARLYYTKFTSIPKFSKNIKHVVTRRLFDQILMLKLMYVHRVKWNQDIMPQFEALLAEYDAFISLDHIGFPINWKPALENKVEILTGAAF